MAIESKNHRPSPVVGTSHSQGSREDARMPVDEIVERDEQLIEQLKLDRDRLVEEKLKLSAELSEMKTQHKATNRQISLGRLPVDIACVKTMKEKERYEKRRSPLSKRIIEIDGELSEINSRIGKYSSLQDGRFHDRQQDTFRSIRKSMERLEEKIDRILDLIQR